MPFCIPNAAACSDETVHSTSPIKGIVTVTALYRPEPSEASFPKGGASSEHYLSIENVTLKALCDLK